MSEGLTVFSLCFGGGLVCVCVCVPSGLSAKRISWMSRGRKGEKHKRGGGEVIK